MKDVQAAVAAYLEEVTGVPAVCDRTKVPGRYPLLAVNVAARGTTLLAGGAQAEHVWAVTVTAVSDRERTDNTALLAQLPPALLRGIPMERKGVRRTLHPLDIRTEGEELTFTVELCVSLQEEPGGDSGPETMQTLHFGV